MIVKRSTALLSGLVVAAAGVLLDGRLGGDGVGDAVPAAAVTTPPGLPPGLTRTELSRVVLRGGGPVEVKPGMDTVVLKIALAPGATIGWHSHPGPGAFLIDSGVATNYGLDGDPCTPVDIAAGEGYFVSAHPKHPHFVRNNGTVPAEATVYYFNVPQGQPTATAAERPATCPADLK